MHEKYKIQLSWLAKNRIYDFVQFNKYYYKKKFSDTWIDDEEYILQMYLTNLNEWVDSFYEELHKKLETGVLWEIQRVNNIYEERKIVLNFWNYIIVVFIKKWLAEKIITIEDIQIRT